MKQLASSLLLIGLTATLVIGLTAAFFSDTETSQANTFQTGQIDLLIGNASYYNGARNPDTNWAPTSLDGNRLFFDFTDIKPGDWGHDTIELLVDDNDSWACYQLEITSADDVDCTEPELLDDPDCQEPNGDFFDGELQSQINFIVWVDDGDSVLETDEYPNKILAQGKAIDVFTGLEGVLADSTANLFTGTPEPLIGGTSYYLGKAWCFGDFSFDPQPQDSLARTNDPLENSGITCNGAGLNNASQTDKLMGDITFRAVQFRHNNEFTCSPSPTLLETLTVPSTNGTGVYSDTVLQIGKQYMVQASGTYRFANWGEYGIADSEWSYRSAPYTPDNVAGWIKGEGYFASECGLDLQLDSCVDWGAFQPSHKYEYTLSGTGLPLHFFIFDNVYSDNSGSLSVKLYQLP